MWHDVGSLVVEMVVGPTPVAVVFERSQLWSSISERTGVGVGWRRIPSMLVCLPEADEPGLMPVCRADSSQQRRPLPCVVPRPDRWVDEQHFKFGIAWGWDSGHQTIRGKKGNKGPQTGAWWGTRLRQTAASGHCCSQWCQWLTWRAVTQIAHVQGSGQLYINPF